MNIKCLHQDLWWQYAKETDYFDEMFQKYNSTIINDNDKKRIKKKEKKRKKDNLKEENFFLLS